MLTNKKTVLDNKIPSIGKITERDIIILKAVCEHQPIGIMKLDEITGYRYGNCRHSLRHLQKASLIKPTPRGAVLNMEIDVIKKLLENELNRMESKINDIRKQIMLIK